MFRVGGYVFKRADNHDEFEQIHRLNHRTFVGEIPQHPDPGGGRLVDKYHERSTYFVAVRDGRVLGMVSAHDGPTFSVAGRMPFPELLQRPGVRPLEIRLLAIPPERRLGHVFGGLVWCLYQHCQARGYSHVFISGVEQRLDLYQNIGFIPLGPAVGDGAARFVPMMAAVADLARQHPRFMTLFARQVGGGEAVCLLPGPVAMAPVVREAFAAPPIYHRGADFLGRFAAVRRQLATLTGAAGTALFNGSGTLANDVIAATLAAEARPQPGVVLVNGEFGERLVRQCARSGLETTVLRWPWGRPWDLDDVGRALAGLPEAGWVWGVHQESSTGVLNDLPGLVAQARRHGVRVCADCMSSLGAVPMDLSGVHLASATSGKSLGAYAGVAIVFADRAALAGRDAAQVPNYLDLRAALDAQGPRFTFPSPLLLALAAALQPYADPDRAARRYRHYAELGSLVRAGLRRRGLEPLAAVEAASPVVTTFTPPAGQSAEEFVARCRAAGFLVGGESGYLAERGLVQVATMGEVRRDEVEAFLDVLGCGGEEVGVALLTSAP